MRNGGPRPLTHPSSFHRPGHAVSVAHCHLWERRGQQRRYARLRLWKGRLRPGWGAVCVPWTPARGSGGLVLGSSPRTSGGPIGLAEASPERQCCCWGRAETPQHPRICPASQVGICVETGLGSPQEPQGTAVWGPAVTDRGAGMGSAGPWLREGWGGDWPLAQSCLRRSNDASCQSRASALTMASLAAPCQLTVS